MRKHVLKLSVLLSIPVAALAVTAFDSNPAQQASLPEFSIIVKTTRTGGVIATCHQGCAWKTLSAEYPQGAYRITQEGVEATVREGIEPRR